MKIIIFIILTLFATNSVFSHEKVREIDGVEFVQRNGFQKWTDRTWRRMIDNGSYALTQVLFDGIDKFDIGILSAEKMRLKARVEREVFDNQDILNSFTVVDRFSMRLNSRDIDIGSSAFTSNLRVGFSFSLGGSLDWINIRQVLANKYSNINSVVEDYQDLNISQGEFVNDEEDTFEEVDTYGDGYFLDPSFRPRTSKLWNLVSFPFKMPLTLKKLNKLSNGELLSYGVSGHVELGPYVGLGFNPMINSDRVGTDAYFRTFLKGQFRITVLKENDRYARVKLTRVQDKGFKWGIAGSGEEFEVFKGFVVANKSGVLDLDVGLIPFEFLAQKTKSKSFDVGFRYDLQSQDAREAFKKAVFGSFVLSEEYCIENKSVQRLFKKQALTRSNLKKYEFDIKIYKRRTQNNASSVEATLTLPGGKHQVFKESKSMLKRWRTIWGTSEKRQYDFNISLDRTAYLQGKENSLQLIVEASIQDSHTNGREMRRYNEIIKKTLGQDNLIPELPIKVPRISNPSKYKVARYKRSSFYYGYNINQDQLERFMKTSKSQMWSLLEKAFNVKKGSWVNRSSRNRYSSRVVLRKAANFFLSAFSFHDKKGSRLRVARSIYKNWSRLSDTFRSGSKTISEKLKLLSRIFKSGHFGNELFKLILFTLKDDELDYFLVATNDSFGRISQRGRITTNPEYLLNLTDENIGFESYVARRSTNPNLLIKNLSAISLDGGKVELSFNIDHRPKVLYFKLFRSNRLQRYKVASELVFRNNNRFKKGLNKIIIDKDSVDSLARKLSEGLELNNYYSFSMNTAQEDNQWSPVSSTRFYYRASN